MLNKDINSSKLYKNVIDKENHKPNVILITLDDFSYELYMENIDILPNLKALKSQSVFFENAFSIGPTTIFALPGIIGNVYPYHFVIGIDKNIPTIATILKNEGYSTAFINEANAFLTPLYGYGKNLDYQNHLLNISHEIKGRKFKDKFLRTEPFVPLNLPYLIKKWLYKHSNERFVKLANYAYWVYKFLRLYLMHNENSFQERKRLFDAFLKDIFDFINHRFESPQFLWIHTVINHAPYFPPEESNRFTLKEIDFLNYRALSDPFSRKICRRTRDLYIESLKKTDQFIGEIFEALKKKELTNNSIIIITADHGEEFKEEGFYGHTSESSSDRLLHVPLIFYWSKLTKRNLNVPVSTIDIVPTLCDLLNIKISDSSKGMSLKALMVHESEDLEKEQNLWQRPLFSEGWETEGIFDRNPGYQNYRIIFTVRKGQYKLKVVRLQRSGNTVSEKLELNNWISHERLDIKNNKLIVEELLYYLYEHIYKEGVFSSNLYENGEKQRIKRTLTRLKGKI